MSIKAKRLFCVLFSSAIITISCNSSKKEDIATSQDSLTVKKSTQLITNQNPGAESGDTVFISGNYVLLFAPSNEEFDKMISTTNDQSLDTVKTAFNSCASQLMDSLKVKGDLPFSMSNKRFIKVKMQSGSFLSFDRTALKQHVGMVMIDGRQLPVIRQGVQDNTTWNAALKKYFMRP